MVRRPQTDDWLDSRNTQWRMLNVYKDKRSSQKFGKDAFESKLPERTLEPSPSLTPTSPAFYDLMEDEISSYVRDADGFDPNKNTLKDSWDKAYKSLYNANFQKTLNRTETKLKKLYGGKKSAIRLARNVVGINFEVRVPFKQGPFPHKLKGWYLIFTLPVVGPQPRTVTVEGPVNV